MTLSFFFLFYYLAAIFFSGMPVFTDQTGHTIDLPHPPSKIISLVPSQTELLYDLGLREHVTGITKFCVHPNSWFRTKTRIGGTKQLNIPLIHSLQPELILGNKEENVKEQVEELARQHPVWISDVQTIEDAYDMIRSVGELTGRSSEAQKLLEEISGGFASLIANRLVKQSQPPQVCYLIWQDPYMTVGGDTFIHDMLKAAGLENMFAEQLRYPVVSIEDLKERQPELLLLSSEPFPFRQKHADELMRLLPQTKVLLVDGEIFSWYGSRMVHAPPYFQQLLQRY